VLGAFKKRKITLISNRKIMTIEEVQFAIDKYKSDFVKITLDDNFMIFGVLQDVHSGSLQDPRGYTEPYLYVIRLDKKENPTEVLKCSEILTIDK
jgi:hypothetical protein